MLLCLFKHLFCYKEDPRLLALAAGWGLKDNTFYMLPQGVYILPVSEVYCCLLWDLLSPGEIDSGSVW